MEPCDPSDAAVLSSGGSTAPGLTPWRTSAWEGLADDSGLAPESERVMGRPIASWKLCTSRLWLTFLGVLSCTKMILLSLVTWRARKLGGGYLGVEVHGFQLRIRGKADSSAQALAGLLCLLCGRVSDVTGQLLQGLTASLGPLLPAASLSTVQNYRTRLAGGTAATEAHRLFQLLLLLHGVCLAVQEAVGLTNTLGTAGCQLLAPFPFDSSPSLLGLFVWPLD